MFGGGGRPALKRVACPTSGKPFAWVRDALRSNMDLPGAKTATLVLERVQRQVQQESPADISDDEGREASKNVFDPRIFE